MKTCPDCAEEVQDAARVCRYCGYRFEPDPDATSRLGERIDAAVTRAGAEWRELREDVRADRARIERNVSKLRDLAGDQGIGKDVRILADKLWEGEEPLFIAKARRESRKREDLLVTDRRLLWAYGDYADDLSFEQVVEVRYQQDRVGGRIECRMSDGFETSLSAIQPQPTADAIASYLDKRISAIQSSMAASERVETEPSGLPADDEPAPAPGEGVQETRLSGLGVDSRKLKRVDVWLKEAKAPITRDIDHVVLARHLRDDEGIKIAAWGLIEGEEGKGGAFVATTQRRLLHVRAIGRLRAKAWVHAWPFSRIDSVETESRLGFAFLKLRAGNRKWSITIRPRQRAAEMASYIDQLRSAAD